MSDEPGVSEKKMSGGLAFLTAGHMTVGVLGDDLMARIDPETTDAALAEPGVRPFDMTGRPVRGWVLVAGDGLTDQELQRWIVRPAATSERSRPSRARAPRSVRIPKGPQPSRAPRMGRNFTCASASSATGSEPATIPQPANSRAVRPETWAHRRAMPHSPLPSASTQPTGPA
jgi:TfoX N-terminal domain